MARSVRRISASAAAALAGLACALATSGAAAGAVPPAPVAAAPVGAASAQTALVRRLAASLAVSRRHGETTGAVAVDLATGETVFTLNGDRSLEPASNEKLPVTFAALTRLGAGYRFHTDVLGAGWRDGTVWHGDLYLKGHGDPTLRTYSLVRLAARVRRAGITRVTGRVYADASWFDARETAPGWKPSFALVESPPISALVVNRAVYHGKVTSDPSGAAAVIFTAVLRKHGVAVDHGPAWGTAPASAELLAQIGSEPLADVVRFMDHWSDNFTAEMLLKTLGAEAAGAGTTAAGARVVEETLAAAGVPLAGVRIVDGSGLSRLDRLTPRAIAAILATAWNDPALREPFRQALAVAGRSGGTLAHRLTKPSVRGRIRGKTGTTDVASALSGYVGDRYAFVVLQNAHPVQTTWAHRAQDAFATALATSPG